MCTPWPIDAERSGKLRRCAQGTECHQITGHLADMRELHEGGEENCFLLQRSIFTLICLFPRQAIENRATHWQVKASPAATWRKDLISLLRHLGVTNIWMFSSTARTAVEKPTGEPLWQTRARGSDQKILWSKSSSPSTAERPNLPSNPVLLSHYPPTRSYKLFFRKIQAPTRMQ